MNIEPDFDPPTRNEALVILLGGFMLMAGSLNGVTDVIMGVDGPSYGFMLGLIMMLAPYITYARRELKKHDIDIFKR